MNQIAASLQEMIVGKQPLCLAVAAEPQPNEEKEKEVHHKDTESTE
jgi:hypothetical protein